MLLSFTFQSMHQPFMSIVCGTMRLRWVYPSTKMSFLCLKLDYICIGINSCVQSTCYIIFRQHVTYFTMQLMCMPSPLLAHTPHNISWCQSFPQLIVFVANLDMSTTHMCASSFCYYNTVPSCSSPFLSAIMCHGIVLMTLHLCGQGIALLF